MEGCKERDRAGSDSATTLVEAAGVEAEAWARRLDGPATTLIGL